MQRVVEHERGCKGRLMRSASRLLLMRDWHLLLASVLHDVGHTQTEQ